MTPERLQEMRANAFKYREAAGYLVEPEEMVSVFEHIDLLHEDLRITRNERDAEKKKKMKLRKDTK